MDQGEIDNFNQLITSSQIEFVISKILPVNKSPELDGFTWEFYQTYEDKMILTLLKLLKKMKKRRKKNEEKGTLPDLFYEATITLPWWLRW